MTRLCPDTPPEVETLLIAGYRRMTLEPPPTIATELHRRARALQRAETREGHPDVDEREIPFRMASRRLGPEPSWLRRFCCRFPEVSVSAAARVSSGSGLASTG